MSARFVACPACARHVKAGECICPFCGAKAPCAEPLRRIGGRLTRAAIHAAGAVGAAVALGDCTTTTVQPGYGIACTPDLCPPFQQDSGADSHAAADASVNAPEASAEDSGDAWVTDGSTSDAGTDAPSDAPDGG
jgi:hypothetical protein